MERSAFTRQVKQEADRLGFDLVGICAAQRSDGFARFQQWLEAGYAGRMAYLSDREDAYRHPRSVLAGVRSVVMLGMNYRTQEPSTAAAGTGRVSRYAWGTSDYHDLIHARLKRLCEFVRRHEPTAAVRGVVDTAPLLEREFAQLAGLGWVGKNTLLLNRDLGSWFFLAALLTDVSLDMDAPFLADHCGTCRACLDACPTDAFPQPYVLDATKCISYLTIELRESIPVELREGMGDWLFGCDVCQDVCPWNRESPAGRESAFAARSDLNPLDLIRLFDLDDEQFRLRFRQTPLWRAKRRGILRNAAIVLGNHRTDRALEALDRGLNDGESLVRAASAWSLGRYASARARNCLAARQEVETDDHVRTEIEAALKGSPGRGR